MALGLGVLVGLAAGAGTALLRNTLDASIKSPDQLREVTQAPTLSRARHHRLRPFDET